MKYPKIRQQTNFAVNIPRLSGGVNFCDPLSMMEDNQLANMRNMWWLDGALRTRPGMRDTGGRYDAIYEKRKWVSDRETLLFHREKVTDDNGKEKAMVYAATLKQDEGFVKLGKGGAGYQTALLSSGNPPSAFGCHTIKGGDEEVEEQSDYIVFLNNGDIIVDNKGDGDDGWVKAEPYVPTVMVYGTSEASVGTGSVSGYAAENMNMLTGAFRCTFAPDGKGEMFALPYKNLTYNDGEIVEVSFQLVNKSTYTVDEYTIELDPADKKKNASGAVYTAKSVSIKPQHIDGKAPSNIQNPSVYACIFYKTGKVDIHVTYTDLASGDSSPSTHPLPQSDADNISVVAWKTNSKKRKEVCKMKQCVWFGNTQLFVCGNPSEKNLVRWSDTGNPLYFPENNYAYIGDYSQAVTALRQQGEMLVAFQEHGMYGFTYDIADSDVYDYAADAGVSSTALEVKVSVTPIHAGIGCDCPQSIRLVNNRLVWATSDAKVYTLPNVNANHEKNVREVSRNIARLLETRSASMLKASVGGEFCGYYTLLVGDRMYLLDTQAGAFTNISYQSRDEQAQKALSWYLWFLPEREAGYTMMANERTMYLHTEEDGVGRVYVMDDTEDAGEPIRCSFTTKQFDFDRPDKLKAVTQIYITVSDTPPETVRFWYISEHGEYGDAWFLERDGEYAEREAGHMRVRRITPNINRVRTIGFRCQSDGTMAIGGIILKFKEQGVVR